MSCAHLKERGCRERERVQRKRESTEKERQSEMRERERERTRERERERMDRMESRVICICIWQFGSVDIQSHVIKSRTNNDFRDAKKRLKNFFSYIRHNSSDNLDNQYF
jgi:hypothetical protein